MAAYGSISISPNATRAGDTSRPNLGAMAISSVNDTAEPPSGEAGSDFHRMRQQEACQLPGVATRVSSGPRR